MINVLLSSWSGVKLTWLYGLVLQAAFSPSLERVWTEEQFFSLFTVFVLWAQTTGTDRFYFFLWHVAMPGMGLKGPELSRPAGACSSLTVLCVPQGVWFRGMSARLWARDSCRLILSIHLAWCVALLQSSVARCFALRLSGKEKIKRTFFLSDHLWQGWLLKPGFV